eukprot:gnl/MRDRNA2_/MRDRNA2_179227_c0_seq1.p1 gnl/MRDRNA2_/MRDRNA2_179227_c0~~gnl/MRDRNA2_/MRDRNA2_179227_c0_seq1.p1  ORF type:complete len:134 (+),score=31.94 gnl/MRDRNA2_/MRDRNA2_179227_c0_seq1:172-573(+)
MAKLEASSLLFTTEIENGIDAAVWFASGVQLVRKLASPEMLTGTVEEILPHTESASLRKAWHAILHLRKKGRARVGPLTTLEHHLALLRYIFLMIRYTQLPSNKHRHLGLAFAGFLAVHVAEAARGGGMQDLT